MWESIINTFFSFWHRVLGLLPKLILAFIGFMVFYIIGELLRRYFKRKLIKRVSNSIVATFTGAALFWLFVILGVLTAARLLGFTNVMGSILAGAGISAIIFGFAFKDILENFLSGFILAIQKPFKVGDIIEVSGFKGPVRALDLRSTQIRISDGRDIWIPNSMIIKGVLTNYTRDGLLRHEFTLSIDMENNVDRARNIILDYIDRVDEILKTPAPNVLVDKITGNGVSLRVLFWIFQKTATMKSDPLARGESIKSHVMRGVKDILLSENFGLVDTVYIEKREKLE